MEHKKISIEDCKNQIQEIIKKKVDTIINTTASKYQFQQEISTTFENYDQINPYEFSFVLFFIKNVNEEDYGYSLSIELYDNHDAIKVRFLLVNGVGSVVIDWKELDIIEVEEYEHLDTFISEYAVIFNLLLKEYILEQKVG